MRLPLKTQSNWQRAPNGCSVQQRAASVAAASTFVVTDCPGVRESCQARPEVKNVTDVRERSSG
jgi:hypothetical protein